MNSHSRQNWVGQVICIYIYVDWSGEQWTLPHSKLLGDSFDNSETLIAEQNPLCHQEFISNIEEGAKGTIPLTAYLLNGKLPEFGVMRNAIEQFKTGSLVGGDSENI